MSQIPKKDENYSPGRMSHLEEETVLHPSSNLSSPDKTSSQPAQAAMTTSEAIDEAIKTPMKESRVETIKTPLEVPKVKPAVVVRFSRPATPRAEERELPAVIPETPQTSPRRAKWEESPSLTPVAPSPSRRGGISGGEGGRGEEGVRSKKGGQAFVTEVEDSGR
ncbi:hypothetical protein MMC12_003749 [Toensbergia leucococca]|nr:hypothetical protein [Toensbergia leucococca]